MNIAEHVRLFHKYPDNYFAFIAPRRVRKIYRALTRRRYISTENQFLWEKMFDFYLWLRNLDDCEYHQKEVCDFLGPIDTLGYHAEEGKFTSMYSDELVSIYSIYPFRGRLTIELCDDSRKRFLIYYKDRLK